MIKIVRVMISFGMVRLYTFTSSRPRNRFQIKRKMSAALVVLGWASYRSLGLDLMPKTDYPTVMVFTSLPGASAEEIETTVTKPIEAAVNTINGIDELRCSSSQGNSRCTISEGSVMIKLLSR